MSETYTVVVKAKNAGLKDNPHGGQLTKWYIGLKSEAGEIFDDVYCQRKPENTISIGDELYGSLVDGDYGWRFKVEQKPENVGHGGSASPTPAPARGESQRQARGGGVTPHEAASPSPQAVRESRIERMAAQKAAVKLLEVAVALGRVPKETSVNNLKQLATQLTNHFVRDIDKAGGEADSLVNSPSKEDSSPPVDPDNPDTWEKVA